ncbi:MAG: FecR domain-containing protein [Puia sp.]|nr:FecR domain-containing protein [Puia sp.]
MTPEFESLLERFLRDELAPAEVKLFLDKARDPANLETLRRIITEKLQQKAYTGLSEKGKMKGKIDGMFRQMLAKAAGYTPPPESEPAPSDNAPASIVQINGMDPSSNEIAPSASEIDSPNSILPWTGPAGKTISLRRLAAIVAAVLLLLAAGMGLWQHHTRQRPSTVQKPPPALKNDVEPGGDKAVLTLSDGSKISLNGAGDGILARQGNTKVVKLPGGQLAYQVSGAVFTEVLYNTMSTPRGGQYRLTLPDGTQVWLNASSSITYPTVFSGKERKVELAGEAYFEVTPHPAMPFKVFTKDMEVDVCGTHFNVNAYGDEMSASTTLLEGAVKVSAGSHPPLTIKPGQRAVCRPGGNMSLVEDADVEETIAWKEGLFSFNGADLPTIMRQLARWYDLDVRYEGTVSKRRFTGKVFRSLRLSETLKVLALNHIHFKLEGDILTVMP